MELKGRVTQKPFGTGTKSEHLAVYLCTDSAEYLLRRKGGNPFRDEVLDGLVGRSIRCSGIVRGYALIMSDWSEIQD